jgi:hypothetical protein
MHSIGCEFRSSFNTEVAGMVNNVRHLEGLSETDFERIRLSLYDAARACVSTGWWSIFWGIIKSRKHVLALFALLTVFVIASIIYFMPALTLMPSEYMAFGIVLAIVIMVVRNIIHSRISCQYITIVIFLETALMIGALETFDRWAHYVRSPWRQAVYALVPPKLESRIRLAAIPAAHVLQLAIWIIAFLAILGLVHKLIEFVGEAIASELDAGYPHATEHTSQLIMSLFMIGYFADCLYKHASDGGCGPSCLPHEKDRERLNAELTRVAQMVRKPWAQTIAFRNGVTGLWIAAQAPRIEFFLRYQQSKNMLIGANLAELRDSMITAALQAIDGNWHLIGSAHEESVATVRARRWKSILRRGFAISLPCAIAFVVAKFMPHLFSPYHNLIIFTCIGYAGVQLLSLIDPEFSARIGLAGKMAANIVKRG